MIQLPARRLQARCLFYFVTILINLLNCIFFYLLIRNAELFISLLLNVMPHPSRSYWWLELVAVLSSHSLLKKQDV